MELGRIKKILTLDGLQYEDTTKEYSAAITLPADATIILQDGSVNTISTQRMIGIECYGNLTVRGKGRLEIKMDAADVEEEPLRTWKYINLEKSSWDAVNGILINGDGDFSLQSSTLAISGVEYGIYFSALGGYEQQDGSLTIEGEKYKKSRGIQASFGTVQCNGKLEITTSDFGVACLFFWVDKNGDAKIKHQGEKYSGRAGIYAGPGLEWKTGAEVESLVMGVSISGGNLIVDDWEKGICIKGMGSYNQKDGIVKATNQKEYGLYVQGGEKVQGNVSVTGGILEAQGETAAIAVIIPKNIESEKQYINIENISEQENSYKTLSSKQTIDGIKTDAVILSEKNNELAKEVRIQCGNYQLSPLKNTINIYVNESLLTLEDGRSYVDGNNRTMVPVRALATAMGMNTEWADASKKVSLSDNAGNEIILTLNKTDYVINGETKIMDTAAVSLPPGRIYVPLRFVVEAFNGEIEYVVDENKTQNIFITTASR